ncbi:LysR family transcriptional regulator [Planomicrobium sp. MB-3u-38]|uniref:LysR family transcriptional regulator n=1 Tax=Planomicrobium sp. MB-3u-38 TaxID=2058318 RepID=UPI000C7D35CD|nr:LysR family transcriptional regulator [Planomicrobium sp. MB-3u-38]PKH12273.1 LysR family transcriptional regulator [Planomicrobium sp. MB-3u-38]
MEHKLEIFVTTAEQKSFTRAAELLHMTPSAISLSIKALESKLECRLFDRTNKYVELTPEGSVVYTHAKEILMQYHDMTQSLINLDPSKNIPISIGAAYTFGEYFLPAILYAFNKKHPNILPNITIQNSKVIAEQIHKQELDIGFIVEADVAEYDVDVNLFSEEMMLIVARPDHPINKNSSIDMKMLEAETWIIREEGSGTRDVTNKFFSQLGIAPKRIMSFGSSQTIKESVALGLGVSYLSESVIKSDVQVGTLKGVSLSDYPNETSFHYITHQSKLHTQAVQIFKEFLDSYVLGEKISVHTKKKIK